MATALTTTLGANLAALGAASLILGSCADPYGGPYAYSGGYGPRPYYPAGYYDSYYGYGYDYGSPRFTSITFISTGDPRWGYDPQVRAYYDFRRRAYYDPYLYAYYPAGYRPVVVSAAPHPHHWRPGYTVIAPPARITNVTLQNLDRHSAYRSSSYSWARQVEQAPRPEPMRAPQRELPPGQVPGHSNRPLDPRFSTGMPPANQPVPASAYQRHYQQALPATPATIPGRGNNPSVRPSATHSNRGDERSAEAIDDARANGAPARAWGNFR